MNRIVLKYCAALLLLLSGGSAAQAQTSYSVSGRIDDPEMEGHKVYLTIYDTNQVIDTATVRDRKFLFEGNAEHPYFARLDLDNNKEYANFVLEDSVVIDLANHLPKSGGKLSEKFLTYWNEYYTHIKKYNSTVTGLKESITDHLEQAEKKEAALDTLKARLTSVCIKQIMNEPDNGVGELAWRDYTLYVCTPKEAQAVYPRLSPFLQNLNFTTERMKLFTALENTSAGKPFIDVEGVDMLSFPYIFLRGSDRIAILYDLLSLPDVKKDEIWFTRLLGPKRYTELYSLSEFDDTKDGMDFRKEYIEGLYGARPVVKGIFEEDL